ncbi:hypothetical protein NIASO_01370 [Niabella soli DSM 19437]|uniref:Uncharacterized protein n=1 Tax=Niabella soli DSM 19437 TaxID=929713 RepID=W0F6J2_9BACT|nr:hypothetical protein NIASO_01370 [Niabella soli DSM 19437]
MLHPGALAVKPGPYDRRWLNRANLNLIFAEVFREFPNLAGNF